MTAINKDTLPQIRKDIDAALKAVATKHGLTFSLGTIRFSNTEFRGKLTAISRNGSSTAIADPKASALKIHSWKLGKDFKETNVYRSDTLGRVKFVGYNRSAKKYPFIVNVVGSTKRYKISALSAKMIVDNGAVA